VVTEATVLPAASKAVGDASGEWQLAAAVAEWTSGGREGKRKLVQIDPFSSHI
jgi:hypothetical protein